MPWLKFIRGETPGRVFQLATGKWSSGGTRPVKYPSGLRGSPSGTHGSSAGRTDTTSRT